MWRPCRNHRTAPGNGNIWEAPFTSYDYVWRRTGRLDGACGRNVGHSSTRERRDRAFYGLGNGQTTDNSCQKGVRHKGLERTGNMYRGVREGGDLSWSGGTARSKNVGR